MSLNLNNVGVSAIYLGNNRIDKIYFSSPSGLSGSSVLVYWRDAIPVPYLDFDFYGDSSFDPNNVNWQGYGVSGGSWSYLGTGTKGQLWRFTRKPFSGNAGDRSVGWSRLFTWASGSSLSSDLTPSKLGSNVSCDIVACGNLNAPEMRNFDSAFANSTSLKNICQIPIPNATNVAGLFNGCVNLESGALAEYTYLSSLSNPPSHSDAFTNCGVDSQTGYAELEQIPVGWGGLYTPPSHSFVGKPNSGKVYWAFYSGYAPSYNDIMGGMHLFTSTSLSTYANVSMNKSRIYSVEGTVVTSGEPTYYYPAFVQGNLYGSGTKYVSWCAITATYNGTLTAAQSSGDMPGTLDDSTYGVFTYERGTYDEYSDLYFGIIVTNVEITSNSDLTNAALGLQYNSNFRDTTFSWYVS